MNPVQSQRWRLVVSDLDGTLLDNHSEISQANQLAIAALVRQGIGFTIATGRIDTMACHFARQMGISLPVIACNGAVIRDCASGRLVDQVTISRPDTMTILHWLESRQHEYLCYSADAVHYPAASRRIHVFRAFNERLAIAGSRPLPLLPIEQGGRNGLPVDLVKILAVMPDRDSIRSLQAFLQDATGCSGVLSMDFALDIMAAGVSKGQALVKLAGLLKCPLEQVVAFGDHDNDADMLKTAGLGIAMADASAAAREAADLVTTENHQSGVAHAIWQYILRADARP